MGPTIAEASKAGRRNTAIAATAVAVGAWSNGTGRTGRRNTAIATTAGAAVAWKSYNDKKKKESRRPRVVRVASRPAPVVYRSARPVKVVKVVDCCGHPGKHKGWHKHRKHHKHCGKHHKHHDCDD
jgi:hypothetical protein